MRWRLRDKLCLASSLPCNLQLTSCHLPFLTFSPMVANCDNLSWWWQWVLPEATARGHDDDVRVTGVWLLAMLEAAPVMMMVITGSCLLCLSLSVTLWCSAAHSLGREARTASDTKRDSETRGRDAGSGSDTLSLTEPETRAQLTRSWGLRAHRHRGCLLRTQTLEARF